MRLVFFSSSPDSRDSQNYTATSVELTRAAEFHWNSCVRGPSRDIKKWRGETGARDERRSREETEGCGQAQDQRFRVTTVLKNGPRAATSGDQPAKQDQQRSCRTSQEPAGLRDKRPQERTESCNKRRTSRDQPAKQDQQRSCRTSQEPAGPHDKRAQERTESCNKHRTSGDQPAKQDQRRKLPDEPRTSRSA